MLKPILRMMSVALSGAFFTASTTYAAAQTLYEDATLRLAASQMGPNVRYMLERDIPPTLPPSLRARARTISVAFPLRGDHPFDVYVDLSTDTVYVPAQTLRFFDDIAILQSWFDSRGCDASWIQAYLWAVLRAQRDMPAPMAAFGLDRARLLHDPFTNDVSGKVLKSAVLFILAHEVGHVVLDHVGGAKGAFSQAQELEADAFALEHYRVIGQSPGGMGLFFLSARWLDRTGVEAAASSHPGAPVRIAQIAQTLAADPDGFSHTELFSREVRTSRVTALAGYLEAIASLSADEGMLTLLPAGFDVVLSDGNLRNACPA